MKYKNIVLFVISFLPFISATAHAENLAEPLINADIQAGHVSLAESHPRNLTSTISDNRVSIPSAPAMQLVWQDPLERFKRCYLWGKPLSWCW